MPTANLSILDDIFARSLCCIYLGISPVGCGPCIGSPKNYRKNINKKDTDDNMISTSFFFFLDRYHKHKLIKWIIKYNERYTSRLHAHSTMGVWWSWSLKLSKSGLSLSWELFPPRLSTTDINSLILSCDKSKHML